MKGQSTLLLSVVVQCWLVVVASDADVSECPTLYLTYKMSRVNNTCFQFYFGKKTWKEARNYCHQNAGRLAMLNIPAKSNYIKNTLNSLKWKADKFWIGLNDLNAEMEWKWNNLYIENEVPITWSNWGSGHPGAIFSSHRDCIAIERDGGQWQWHEDVCNVYGFEYRFICEYEIQNSNTANENSGLVNIPTTTTTTKPTPDIHIRHGSSRGQPPRGNSRIVTSPVLEYDEDDFFKKPLPDALGSQDSDDSTGTHVPMYTLILSFGCGFLLAIGVVLFFVIRRRRRKKLSHLSPHVVYHAPPDGESGDGPITGGAAGGAPAVCVVPGKSSKSAEARTCQPPRYMYAPHSAEDAEQAPSRQHLAAANVYVDSATGVTRVDSPIDSICSLGTLSMEEAPPAYDEVIAGILSEKTQKAAANAYVNSETQTSPSKGAIPKTVKKSLPSYDSDVAVDGYIPMNGSRSSLNSNPRNSGADEGAPRSLGELPPIPTDDGYEIPVSRPPTLRVIASTNLSAEPRASQVSNVESNATEYSEIPERRSMLYKEDDEIYSTID